MESKKSNENVVRCAECKWRQDGLSDGHVCHACRNPYGFYDMEVDLDEYCSRGELQDAGKRG